MSLKEQIKDLAKKFHEEIIYNRRYIHAHPELAFEEINTANFVAQKLKEFDIPFQSGIAKTGIVAILEATNPESGTIALRSDLDALPITEENDVEYASTNEGIMHACGHDVHTACMLGAARILSELRDNFSGTVKFIFQPSEEKLPGGASEMIKEGVLKNPEPSVIMGQHVMSEIQSGKVGFRSGKYMASSDEIYITIKGRGGHAALPKLNVNPLLIAAHVLIALREKHKKFNDPSVPSVLNFGKIEGMGATNIIPDIVKIEGTFRTMDEDWRQEAHLKMKQVASDTAKKLGGKATLKILKGYPFLENDKTFTERARSYAEDYLGKANVVNLPIRMTADDFAYYTHQVPACYYRLGIRNEEKGITSSVHTPTFDVDEDALETGAGLMAWLALRQLGN